MILIMKVNEERRIGEIIRKVREEKGMSIERLSDITKISKEFIKAIEEENFDVLPGDVYVKGFIRNISLALGLDPDEMRELYKAVRKSSSEDLVIKEAKEKLPAYDAKVEKGVKPRRPWLLILIFLILLVGGGFYFYASWTGEVNIFNKASSDKVKESLSPLSTEKNVAELKEEPVTVSTPAQSSKEEMVSLGTGSAFSLPSTGTTEAQSLSLLSEEATRPVKAERFNLRVVAVGRCWVRVFADGKKVFEGTLVKGDERTWEAEESIVVRFGNINGVRVYFNGEEVTLPPSRTGVVDMTFPQ
ncbi:MAG: hypothetical protein PWQ16_1071 [bacterium]|nr:hypothetical protein [bacterium]